MPRSLQNILLIAPGMDSEDRNKAFGIKLPLLGYPAISLAMIAALTPENIRVRLVDVVNEPVPYGEPCDLALIVGQTHHMPTGYLIADRLRDSGVKVILGGMHVSAFPEEGLEHGDAVIIREGEAVWNDILEDFVGDALKKKYYGPETEIEDLPFIRRDLFNKKFYHPGEILETTRGCPVGCHFCAVQDFFGTRFRVRSAKRIKQEILEIFGPRPPQAKWKN